MKLAAVAVLALASRAVAAPALGGPNHELDVDDIDPQIAASGEEVIVTLYDTAYLFDRSLKPTGTINLYDVFGRLFDPKVKPNLNDRLDLPSGAACDRDNPTSRTFKSGGKTGPSYCLNRQIYDARVLYDEFRDRFVIVGTAFNEMSKCKFNPAAILSARRTKIVVAYSTTNKPTTSHDWRVSWMDGVPGESCTTDECRKDRQWVPGTAADYPVIGLDKSHLMVAIDNNSRPILPGCVPAKTDIDDKYPSKTKAIFVRWADALAAGKESDEALCKGLCDWSYFNLKHDDGSALATGSPIGVDVAHGKTLGDDSWFASQSPTTGDIELWHFSSAPTKTVPKIERIDVKSKAFSSPAPQPDYPQRHTAAAPTPKRMRGDDTMSLVGRDNRLYVAGVGGMKDRSGDINASIRVVELVGATTGGRVTVVPTRTEIFTELGIGLTSPAIAVDAKQTIVMTYRKLGDGLSGFGARYLVWPVTGKAEGRSLADNEDSIQDPKPPKKKDDEHDSEHESGKFDTVGIGLSPDGRVYMIQPYIQNAVHSATKAVRWEYAINFVTP